MKRFDGSGIMSSEESRVLKETYSFYRTIESLLRLKGESVLKKQGGILEDTAEFIGLEGAEVLVAHIERKREEIGKIAGRHLG